MEENTTMAVEMTADEFAKFKAFQQKQLEEQRQAAEKKMRENYREMVDDAIESMMPNLKSISESLATYKKKVFDEFKAVIDIKEEMFKLNNKELDNQSHTFTNTAGTKIRCRCSGSSCTNHRGTGRSRTHSCKGERNRTINSCYG